MNKKGGMSSKGIIGLAAIILVLAVAGFYFGTQYTGGAPSTTPAAVVTTTTPATVTCDLGETSPDLDINAYDKENPGTALTEGTNIFREVGTKTWTTWTQGTEITAGLIPGKTYEFVTGISTTDFIDNAYGPYFQYTVKCLSDDTMEIGVYNDEVDTSLTGTFYNNDNNAAAETFSAGDVKSITLRWKAGSDEVYGNPFIAESGLGDVGNHRAAYPNALCLHLNSTAWDVPDEVSVDGVEMRRISNPILNNANGNSSHSDYCYEAPVIMDKDVRIVVTLDADDSNAPVWDEQAYLYAGNFYIDEEGDLKWGVETDNNAVVGSDGEDSIRMDFTA